MPRLLYWLFAPFELTLLAILPEGTLSFVIFLSYSKNKKCTQKRVKSRKSESITHDDVSVLHSGCTSLSIIYGG